MTKRVIFLVLIFLNLATIFFFSHQDSATSTAVSNSISRQIEVRTPDYVNKTQGEKNVLHTGVQRTLRRGAHLLLFFTLGILTYLFFCTFQKRWFVFVGNLMLGFLIALSDEFHQTFVPGRSFGWDDISYDMIGFFLGTLLTLLAICISNIFHKKKKL